MPLTLKMRTAVGNIVLRVLLLAGLNAQTLENSEFRLVIQPNNVTVKAETSTILNCAFNEPVKCSWTRNSTVITMSERYKYNAGKEELKTDCSITIESVDKIDIGPWICTFKASDKDPIQSDPVYLSITKNFADENTPPNDPKSTTPTNNGDDSGFSDKLMWISVAGGLVALSILNTVIVICCRRRARSRRSSRKTTPTTSCHASPVPIIINSTSNTNRRSTLGQPCNYEMRLIINDEPVRPYELEEMLDKTKKGRKYEKEDKKDYQHYVNVIGEPEPALYEEIVDY